MSLETPTFPSGQHLHHPRKGQRSPLLYSCCTLNKPHTALSYLVFDYRAYRIVLKLLIDKRHWLQCQWYIHTTPRAKSLLPECPSRMFDKRDHSHRPDDNRNHSFDAFPADRTATAPRGRATETTDDQELVIVDGVHRTTTVPGKEDGGRSVSSMGRDPNVRR